MIRIGVLASGEGSNLQALLDACARGEIDGRVEVVVSNVPTARALERGRRAGCLVVSAPSKGTTDREAYDRQLLVHLEPTALDLVCLAGYKRVLTPSFVRAFGPSATSRGCPRIMNIHPALLPSFPGLHAQRNAIEYGARISGCTVHFVDEGTDTGPIIAQAVVPVHDRDTEETLAARILEQEHLVYPRAVRWFAQGRLSLEGRRVTVLDADTTTAPVFRIPRDE